MESPEPTRTKECIETTKKSNSTLMTEDSSEAMSVPPGTSLKTFQSCYKSRDKSVNCVLASVKMLKEGPGGRGHKQQEGHSTER